MRWPATERRRSRPGATSTTPSRSSSRGCSTRFRLSSAVRLHPETGPMAESLREPPGVTAARQVFYTLGSVGLVVAALYWGQRILVPLALAVLLTLLLSPVVARLERLGFGRFPAVL